MSQAQEGPAGNTAACPYCGTAVSDSDQLCPGCGCELPRAASRADGVAAIVGNVGKILMLLALLAVLVLIVFLVL